MCWAQCLQSLESRLKGRRTATRLYYKAPRAEQPQAGAVVLGGQDWLRSDDIIITVGALRYGQTSCLQVCLAGPSLELVDACSSSTGPVLVQLDSVQL